MPLPKIFGPKVTNHSFGEAGKPINKSVNQSGSPASLCLASCASEAGKKNGTAIYGTLHQNYPSFFPSNDLDHMKLPF